MTEPRRPSTVGLLVGLALGMAVGFALGITVALAAFVPDPAPGPGSSSTGSELVPGDPVETPAPTTGSTLSRQELDECLRAAGIDPAGPRPTGSVVCVGAVPPAPGAPRAVPVPETAPRVDDPAFTTAPPLTVAPTSR